MSIEPVIPFPRTVPTALHPTLPWAEDTFPKWLLSRKVLHRHISLETLGTATVTIWKTSNKISLRMKFIECQGGAQMPSEDLD